MAAAAAVQASAPDTVEAVEATEVATAPLVALEAAVDANSTSQTFVFSPSVC